MPSYKAIKNILIAPDSFKDCLPSHEVARFLAAGISGSAPKAETTIFPVSDGGEGAASCIAHHCGGIWVELSVADPLFRPVPSRYLVLSDNKTAIIELAGASGLELLSAAERNPANTSTFGTGELIRDALDKGMQKIILTVGGSATVDGGTGIASALGFQFYDKSGKEIELMTGGVMNDIHFISGAKVHPLFWKTEMVIATDVQNYLNGNEGAARVYGPQKGAGKSGVALLESGLSHLSSLVYKDTGFDSDTHPGTGAAGGASLFLIAYGKGIIRKGFDLIVELTGFMDAISGTDLVITGEGKIDSQTVYGKVVASVAAIAASLGIPLVAVAGRIDDDNGTVKKRTQAAKLYSIRELATDDNDSLKNASGYLTRIGSLIAEEFINQSEQ